MLFFFFVLPYYVCDIHMLLFCTSSTVDTLQLWCTQNSSSLSSSRRITSRHRLPVNWPWLKPIWKEPKNVPSLVKSMFHVWCFDANIGFERCWLIVVVVEISLCFFSRVFHYCIYAAGSKSENFNNAFSCVCFLCAHQNSIVFQGPIKLYIDSGKLKNYRRTENGPILEKASAHWLETGLHAQTFDYIFS